MPKKTVSLDPKTPSVKKVRKASKPRQSPAVSKIAGRKTLAKGKTKQSSPNVPLKSNIKRQRNTTKSAKAPNVAKKKTGRTKPPLVRQRERISPFAPGKKPSKPIKPIGRKQSFLKISDQYPILLFPVRLETKFMAGGKELWVRVFPDDITVETHEAELTKDEVLEGRRLLFEFQKARIVAAQSEVAPLNTLKSSLGNNWDEEFQALSENSSKRQELWPAYSELKNILEKEEQQRKAAWRELASEFGPERAVWISRQAPAYKDADLENLREDEWTSTAKVRVFPDYFEFNLYDENDQIIDKYKTQGKRIPNELPLMAEAQAVTSKEEKTDLILQFFNTVESESELMGRASETLGLVSVGYLHTTFFDRASKTITHKPKSRRKPPVRFATVEEIEQYWEKSLIDPKSKYNDLVDALYGVFIKNFESSFFDRKAQWLEDFDAAIKIGMAVKIQLTDVPPPFKRIIAVGVKESLNETASVKMLGELFENHQYTEGLGFLEPGTPTNNTTRVKSGHSESTEDYDRIFDDEFGNKNELNEDKSRDARRWENRLKKYLGFDSTSEVFSRCENAERWEDSYQEYMNSLFWESTGEYFLKVLLGRLVPKSSDLWRNIRDHVGQYIRPLGLLPTMRVGNLPYGLLPVTNTSNWMPLAISGKRGFGSGFSAFLKKLLSQWIVLAANSGRVPRIGNSTNSDSDGNQDLLQILGMESSALSYTLRLYSDRRFLEWWAFEVLGKGESKDPGKRLNFDDMIRDWEGIRQQTQKILRELGASADNVDETLLLRLWGWENESEYSWDNPFPLAIHRDTQGTQSLSTVFGGLKDFIEGNANRQTTSIPETLLYQLLHFLPRDEQSHLLITDDIKKLLELDVDHARHWLERLFTGYLDTTTHRLDAWVTSLAHKRLEEMREKNKEGIYLGAYGCLEDLSPNATASRSKTTRVNKLNVEGGYIHAPSLNHASAAAVLRNAFLTYEGREENRPFAINLTSTRIRRACRILSGIREGQPLAALLGYQIERSLHDKKLDQYINEFRTHYPFPEQNEGPSSPGQTSSTESIKPRNVLNGLKLVQGIRLGIQRGGTTKSNVLKKIGVSNIQSGDGPRLLETLSEACDAIDAMTDLLLNESIYQWVQGKFEHAGAALQAMSGQAKPPEVDSIKTPVTGVSARHRVAVVFPYANSNTINQSRIDVILNIRGAMEPTLDRWVGGLLKNREEISCRVKFNHAGKIHDQPITADRLRMYPSTLR